MARPFGWHSGKLICAEIEVDILNVIGTTGALKPLSGNSTTTFTNATLSNGVLTVTHNLGTKYVTVQIYDNNDKLVLPDEITLSTANTVQVDLGSFVSITGTWRVVIIG